jgi:hypothetical protein
MAAPVQLARGARFGRLTVCESAGINRYGTRLWIVRCDCGVEKAIQSSQLFSGRTRSCGCLAREIQAAHGRALVASRMAEGRPLFYKHGYATKLKPRSLTYRTWLSMRSRCSAVNTPYAKHYVLRGIRVCERWATFENFLADMGERPSRRHSIDRINNDGNYEPSNCRWATPSEQARNQRRRRKSA